MFKDCTSLIKFSFSHREDKGHKKYYSQIINDHEEDESLLEYYNNNEISENNLYQTFNEIYTFSDYSSINKKDEEFSNVSTVSSFYKKIPIFHVEAGLRTHNLYYPFPEEFNRITIDDLSTLHFAPTEWALNNLIKENQNSDNIYLTGNTIVDSLQMTLNKTSPSPKIKILINKSKYLCISKTDCKIIIN